MDNRVSIIPTIRATRNSPLPPAAEPEPEPAPAGRLQRATRAITSAPARAGHWVDRHVPSYYVLLTGHPPAYKGVDAADKAAAVARGAGLNAPQPSISGHADGTEISEPVNVIWHGSLHDLVGALKSQGWHKGRYPVSPMYVDGHRAEVALCKNETMSRDHLRIYNLGQDRWGIAASRDLTATMTTPGQGHKLGFGHKIDHHVDPERDLIMHDILAALPQLRSSWQAVHGMASPPITNYQTDGYVYVVGK